MFDKEATLTLQQRENLIYNTAWESNYITHIRRCTNGQVYLIKHILWNQLWLLDNECF